MYSKEEISRICNGDQGAAQVVSALNDLFHMIDDFVDKDKEVTQEDCGKMLVNLFVAVTVNPFWQKYGQYLIAPIIQGIRAWIDADKWIKSGVKEKVVAADIFKSYYRETFMHIAYLTGGYENLKKVSAEHRKVNWNNPFIGKESK